MQKRYVYIHTFGCQMNVYDSDMILRSLRPLGYAPASAPHTADVIIANTCAIRHKAEEKAFSFVGRLAALKRSRPELIIAVGGCVAQQQGRRILARIPCVDVVFGTGAIARLPRLIERVAAERCRLVDVSDPGTIAEMPPVVEGAAADHVTAFVTVMQGCDNFCTYCVVPYVRGREKSRRPEDIVEEIERLVAGGVREVTLLGQNVNSYGRKEGYATFAELLARVNDVQGLKRIRFTTSHPKDLSRGLMQAFVRLDKLCPHLHLPVQSGSDRILRRMNRRYTRRDYLEKIERLRRLCPAIAISSDFIVGFPGETETDFGNTLALLAELEYDGIFAFKYSDRPDTPAARFQPKVPETEKQQRLQRLLEIQDQISRKKLARQVGRAPWVLVERASRTLGGVRSAAPGTAGSGWREHQQWSGRTTDNRIVHFCAAPGGPAGRAVRPGRLVRVRIESAMAHSLWGRPEAPAEPLDGLKGDKTYAA
jgi:tRNA-2-methylthio-N6-dimethylallyladenosine synthase